MAELVILDVGHGSSAVLSGESSAVIIDAGLGETILELLEQRHITTIDIVLISHADADHVAGLLTLLAQEHLHIGIVCLNSETFRTTVLWRAFLIALTDARRRGAVRVHPQLTSASERILLQDDVEVQILGPSPEMALVGAGGQQPGGGGLLSANAMSAVIRVMADGVPEVLLPGDLDGIGLELLLAEQPEPRARMLVFPHHGGHPGRADPFDFAARFCAAVQPEVVVFSIGRGKHATPQPGVIRGVLSAVPNAHIACTQLSERCATSLPNGPPTHLIASPARGRAANRCCAGSIRVTLGEVAPTYAPSRADHRNFVQSEAPTALCLGRAVVDGMSTGDGRLVAGAELTDP